MSILRRLIPGSPRISPVVPSPEPQPDYEANVAAFDSLPMWARR